MQNSPDIFVAIGVGPGLKIRLARIARGWRQVDLAFFAQVTQHDVSSLEKDYRTYPAARLRVLEALGLEEES